MVLTSSALNNITEDVQTAIGSDFDDGAIGTDGTNATTGDTSLGNEVLRKDRTTISDSQVSGGSGTTTVSQFISSTEANGNTIREFGIFTNAGDLQQRDTFQAIDKNNDIELFFDVSVNIEVTQQ